MESRDTDLRVLVGRLNNLHEIFRVQGEILTYGEEAVEPLAALLVSEPSGFSEPRVAAAECLEAIGTETAIGALIRVLDYHDLKELEPVQRFAEENVRNAAARRLARFRQPQVVAALLLSLQRDHLIGAGQALAEMEEAAAIPYLIECLEDDYKKEKANEALRRFGYAAVPQLCNAVEHPRSVYGVEPPLSQERRYRAAELLGQLKAPESVPVLQAATRDHSKQVRIVCSIALAEMGIVTEPLVCQLLGGLDDPDLLTRKNCEEALEKSGPKAVPLLARASRGYPLYTAPEGKFRLSLNGRLAAIKLLGLTRQGDAVLCLMERLKDPEEIVRYRAVVALKDFKDAEVREVLERVAREDPAVSVRVRAREVLRVPMERKVLGLWERFSANGNRARR